VAELTADETQNLISEFYQIILFMSIETLINEFGNIRYCPEALYYSARNIYSARVILTEVLKEALGD